MLNVSRDLEKDKKKNKPNIVAPIINTVISGVAIVAVIILKILTSEFNWGLFICFMVVLVLFPVASWYNSYFSKKQKTKMLNLSGSVNIQFNSVTQSCPILCDPILPLLLFDDCQEGRF